jgi:hypothetical protein
MGLNISIIFNTSYILNKVSYVIKHKNISFMDATRSIPEYNDLREFWSRLSTLQKRSAKLMSKSNRLIVKARRLVKKSATG